MCQKLGKRKREMLKHLDGYIRGRPVVPVKPVSECVLNAMIRKYPWLIAGEIDMYRFFMIRSSFYDGSQWKHIGIDLGSAECDHTVAIFTDSSGKMTYRELAREKL